MTRISVPAEMLVWACERAGWDCEHLAARIPQLAAWIRGHRHPTLKQLEKFAKHGLTIGNAGKSRVQGRALSYCTPMSQSESNPYISYFFFILPARATRIG